MEIIRKSVLNLNIFQHRIPIWIGMVQNLSIYDYSDFEQNIVFILQVSTNTVIN